MPEVEAWLAANTKRCRLGARITPEACASYRVNSFGGCNDCPGLGIEPDKSKLKMWCGRKPKRDTQSAPTPKKTRHPVGVCSGCGRTAPIHRISKNLCGTCVYREKHKLPLKEKINRGPQKGFKNKA